MARDEKLMVRLTPEMKEKFQEIAGNYGMTMSSLGSFVIGQFVSNQVNIVDPMQKQLSKVMEDIITEQAKKAINEEVGK